jgi:hypothetical protein
VTITPLPTVTPVGVETLVVPPTPDEFKVPPGAAAPDTMTRVEGVTGATGDNAADPLLKPPEEAPVTITAPGVPGMFPGTIVPPMGPGAIVPPIGPGIMLPPTGAGARDCVVDAVAPEVEVCGVTALAGATVVAVTVVGTMTAGLAAGVGVVAASVAGATTAVGPAAAAKQLDKSNVNCSFISLNLRLRPRQRKLRNPD